MAETGQGTMRQVVRVYLRKRRRAERLCERPPTWKSGIVEPIAQELANRMDGVHYTVTGPFGLCSAVDVEFLPVGGPEHKRETVSRKVTFVPGDLDKGEVLICDYWSDTGEYAPGSIGYLNGLNHPCLPIPPDADIGWMLEFVR